MDQEEILNAFRRDAEAMENEAPALSKVILDLARLLADSRGRLSKEHFEALMDMGAVLYKQADAQFQGRSDVNAIMKQSAESYRQDK